MPAVAGGQGCLLCAVWLQQPRSPAGISSRPRGHAASLPGCGVLSPEPASRLGSSLFLSHSPGMCGDGERELSLGS